jgi:2-iminobutanoate/2-iminopropanoate deaminase
MNNSSKVLIGVALLAGLGLVAAGLSAAPPADKKAIYGASKPIGPYSPAVDVGDMVFLAGQIGIDPAAGKMVAGGIEAETKQVMENARVLLLNAGLDFEDVVKTTVFLADINDFQAMNGVYASYFPEGAIPPARSTVAVTALAAGAKVEIDFIAAR